MFVVAYVVALHLMVFWVIARWGHGPSHHIGGTELQLLCTRQVGPSSPISCGWRMLLLW
jgi:hypothetical protein